MAQNVDYIATSVAMPAQDVWNVALPALQSFVLAVIVLIIGLIVSNTLSTLAKQLISKLGVDKAMHKLGISQKMEEIGLEYKVSSIIGWIVKWFFLIVTFLIVANQLQLTAVTDFLTRVVVYIPNVIVAVGVLAVGLLAAQFVHGAVLKALQNTNLEEGARKMVALTSKYAITIFAFFAALTHLGIASDLINTLFTGIIFALSLALGLAFGLGGKEHANRFLENLRK